MAAELLPPAARSTGTMWPWATSSVPHRAASPIQRRLGPTASPPCPVPMPTSQPSVCESGAERASAGDRPGTGTAGWRSQLMPDPSVSPSSRSSSSRAGSRPIPPAHTTTRPSPHEAWRRATSVVVPSPPAWLVQAPVAVGGASGRAVGGGAACAVGRNRRIDGVLRQPQQGTGESLALGGEVGDHHRAQLPIEGGGRPQTVVGLVYEPAQGGDPRQRICGQRSFIYL